MYSPAYKTAVATLCDEKNPGHTKVIEVSNIPSIIGATRKLQEKAALENILSNRTRSWFIMEIKFDGYNK